MKCQAHSSNLTRCIAHKCKQGDVEFNQMKLAHTSNIYHLFKIKKIYIQENINNDVLYVLFHLFALKPFHCFCSCQQDREHVLN